jgi:hypothetical protein
MGGHRPTSTCGATVKGIHFLPLSFSLLFHFTSTSVPNRGATPSFFSLSPPSKSMEVWRFNQEKGSRLEAKGSPKAPLHFPIRVHWIQLEFLSPKVFKSSFCPTPYMVQRFEFPLVEHLMRSPRRHTYRSMLTVKIRQPSHEFTFGVGMSFIPYPLVLTPMV